MSSLSRTLVYKSNKSHPTLVKEKAGQSPAIFMPSNPGKGTLGTQLENLCSRTQFLMTS